MVSTQNRRLGQAGLLLGTCALAFVYLVPGRETVDANERINALVETASLAGAVRPLDLSLAEVATVSRTTVAERLRVSGEVQPVRSVVLRSRTAGRITEIAAQEGQAVKAGDVLVRFETADLQSTLLQRQSESAVAEAELLLRLQASERAIQLATNNIVSAEKLEQAKSDVAVARSRLRSLSAQVDMARVALGEAEVIAPFDGVVAAKTVEAGTRVGDDADLLTMVDMSTLDIKVLVSTRDIPRVETGQIAQLQFDGLESRTFRATVSRINPVADTGTRFVTVYLRLAPQKAALWGGMFATGTIIIREKADALLVPALSLRNDVGGNYVLKVENGRLQRQPVTVGKAWNGGMLVDIADGLGDGDTIVTAPLPELRPDVTVNVNKAG